METLENRIVSKGLETLKALEDAKHKLEVDINILRHEVQAACPHPAGEVVRAPHTSYDGVVTSPPFNLCRRCGYAEEAWHIHGRLNGTYPTVSREEAFKFLRGPVLTGETLRIEAEKAAARQAPCA